MVSPKAATTASRQQVVHNDTIVRQDRLQLAVAGQEKMSKYLTLLLINMLSKGGQHANDSRHWAIAQFGTVF